MRTIHLAVATSQISQAMWINFPLLSAHVFATLASAVVGYCFPTDMAHLTLEVIQVSFL